MPKYQEITKIIIGLTLFVLLVFTGFFIVASQDSKQGDQQELNSSEINLAEPLSILVLGADSIIPGDLKGWYGRSDFIAVLHINPVTNEVSIISIPRDTKIHLNKYKITKINSANQVGGYKLARRAVKRLLGIRIDHVVVFSIQTVIDLINDVGKFKIYVPKQMHYDDNSANLHIDIKPGLQDMDGETLMNFLRYRSKDQGDIGRIQRQQIFFRSAIRKLKEPDMIFKLPGLLFSANKAFLTDMEFAEMFELGILLRSLSPKSFHSYIVPGDFGANGYWLPNMEKLNTLIESVAAESRVQIIREDKTVADDNTQ